MKKKIIMLVAAFSVFAGVVSASSINGDYKGNSIVKVKVNGNFVNSDVPGINLDGTTMLPVRAISEALGAEVKWDQNTYTASISSSPRSSSANEDIRNIKMYSKLAEQYKRIIVLGDAIANLSNMLSYSETAIMNDVDNAKVLANATKQINNAVNMYNTTMETTNAVKKEAESSNIEGAYMYDAELIFKEYSDGINYFKESYKGLEKLAQQKSEANFNIYFDNRTKGFDILTDNRYYANERYFEYYNKIQNY
ncbi:stalk domain-containing protein [Paenibacillus chitinolyticus]